MIANGVLGTLGALVLYVKVEVKPEPELNFYQLLMVDKFAKELIKKPEVVTQMIPLVNLQKELLLTIYLACV